MSFGHQAMQQLRLAACHKGWEGGKLQHVHRLSFDPVMPGIGSVELSRCWLSDWQRPWWTFDPGLSLSDQPDMAEASHR